MDGERLRESGYALPGDDARTGIDDVTAVWHDDGHSFARAQLRGQMPISQSIQRVDCDQQHMRRGVYLRRSELFALE